MIASSEATEISLDEEDLKNFSSTEEALESVGFSFKTSNNELTFHGLWNSSIKVYLNGILMNDPNTGKFDFSSLDIHSVRSIKIDPISSDGAVSVYIETLLRDYTKVTGSLGGTSLSYFSSENISPNDTWRLFGSVNFPLILNDGSALVFQENLVAGYDANHFGYMTLESSYEPDFSDSYSAWELIRSGWESALVGNSFSAVYSSNRLPGATFGFSNFTSWKRQNCGRVGGFYYSYEKEDDFNSAFAFPVFVPFRNFRIKVIPSYKVSGIDYEKDAAFSKVSDQYSVHSFSLSEESTILKFLKINSKSTFDFSQGKNLLNVFVDPGFAMNLGGFDFSFDVPVNFFYTKNSFSGESGNRFDFLFSAKIEKEILPSESDFPTHIFLSASRNVTTPVFQQLYYSGSGGKGNANLKTESALSYYAGITFGKRFLFSINPFLIFYEDKIAWNPDSFGNWTPLNVGSSINKGFDIVFDTDSLLKFLKVKTSYTLCRANLTTDDTVMGNQIMYTPVHNLVINLEVPLPNDFLFSAIYKFSSQKFTDNTNVSSVPATHLLNSKIEWDYKKFEFYVLWENMLDLKYVPISGYPGPGTSITLGAKYCF